MQKVHFMGYVEPRQTLLNVENLTPIEEMNIATGRKTTYTIAILHSVVSVECELEVLHQDEISQLYTRAVELSRTLVNLIAIRHGWGLTVHIDTFIHADGTEEFLMNRADTLTGIIDAYNLDDVDGVFQKVACDVDFSMALNDMIDAISRPRTTAVCCARAIDTIKNLLAPGIKDKPGWRVLQDKLRADESYVQHISNASKSSRHGAHSYLPVDDAEEIMKRTWTITNRYFYHRLRSGQELPPDQFEQLTAPKPEA
jgi:hypothetical protein